MPRNRSSPTHLAVERRRSPRTPVVVRVEYETVDEMFSEFTRNVNEGGLFIETERPLAVDEQVQLLFRLPGSPDPIKASGRVSWVSPGDGSAPPGMGIVFESLDQEARARIDALVKRLRVERNL
jgi:uncharacterized protein (TIGR02266 family)